MLLLPVLVIKNPCLTFVSCIWVIIFLNELLPSQKTIRVIFFLATTVFIFFQLHMLAPVSFPELAILPQTVTGGSANFMSCNIWLNSACVLTIAAFRFLAEPFFDNFFLMIYKTLTLTLFYAFKVFL